MNINIHFVSLNSLFNVAFVWKIKFVNAAVPMVISSIQPTTGISGIKSIGDIA